jgi:hypothetical protein
MLLRSADETVRLAQGLHQARRIRAIPHAELFKTRAASPGHDPRYFPTSSCSPGFNGISVIVAVLFSIRIVLSFTGR